MPKYRILALDGGGVRGLVTAVLLKKLSEHKDLQGVFDHVDLIAGNSSGGLIALAMAHGLGAGSMHATLGQVCQVFTNGKNVFGPGIPFPIGRWLVSKYTTRHRRARLQQLLGPNRKLKELNKKVLITSFDLDNEGWDEEHERTVRLWKPKLFHNFERVNGEGFARANQDQPSTRPPDREIEAWRVALYTTAAPTYFPSADGFIDGGVYANNPAMCALAQVLDNRYQLAPDRSRVDPRDILLLSIGAGRHGSFIQTTRFPGGGLFRKWWNEIHWGAITKWAAYYVDLSMEGTIGIADYQCSQMLGTDRYRRINLDFDQGSKFKLDDTGRVDDLLRIVERYVTDATQAFPQHVDWLKRNWMPAPERTAPPLEVTSKHLLGTTELTCLLPIRQGFVGEFETRTFATRLRIALRVFHSLRVVAREATARVFPDVVDLIRSIQSFRLAVVNEKQLLLAATFDRPWEPYMRIVWKGLGPLLDPLLINCVDYEEHASDKGFERFASWVRRYQVEAGLFYTASAMTVDDTRYLTQLEQMQRESTAQSFEKEVVSFVPVDLKSEAKKEAAAHPEIALGSGLRVLSALYALRDSYPDRSPDGTVLPDGRYLRTAAREILRAFDTAKLSPAIQKQFEKELAWLGGAAPQPKEPAVREPEYHDMQGGIIPRLGEKGVRRDYRAAHACLLLLRVVDPGAARAFLRNRLNALVTSHEARPSGDVYVNVAFTFNGLKRLEVPESGLSRFPKEFREGMEARAGLLGDVQANHPTNWSLPDCNWPDGQKTLPVPVPLSSIDIVVKLRSSKLSDRPEHAWTPRHPLHAYATGLFVDPKRTGMQVMSVQPMIHYLKDGRVIDHFNFVDGISQPDVRHDRDPGNENWDNQVALGELFLGYHNDRGDPAFSEKGSQDALPGREMKSLLDNGTFLVVRKLRQDVGAMTEFLRQNDGKHYGLGAADLAAKMLGRDADGNPLTTAPKPPPDQNTFDYTGDSKGDKCPLHAHIRRANPRDGRVPRIVRRGMSYGPAYTEDTADAERGLMFLAYNASIAEQFEVIQRWMTGGNSTGGFSAHADPFLQVPQLSGGTAAFRFNHGNNPPVHLDLVKPFVTLKWGVYLFVPSLTALGTIAADPIADVEAAQSRIALGEKIIASLTTDEDWSAILEDVTATSSGATSAVYAAIRARGGVLRTPGQRMVLVASEALAMEVLRRDDVFSVREYLNRMEKSIGRIYLGLDQGEEYRVLSELNDLVSRISEPDAFRVADNATEQVLTTLLELGDGKPVTIALDTLADLALAAMSKYWFGVPNGAEIKSGGRPAAGAQTVHLPYHALPPSRYIFSSPLPRPPVTLAGQRYGRELREALTRLAADKGIAAFDANIPRELWDWIIRRYGRPDPDQFGRMLVGLMEGFLPTVHGNFLKTLHLWLSEETLWRVQQNLKSQELPLNAAIVDYHRRASDSITAELKRAMQRRPVPDMVYRTATRRHELGGVRIEAGERVVVLIASATQELAARRQAHPDVMPVFGGDRRAPEPPKRPTHACPAYNMAIGVLLGMIHALLEIGILKPTVSPLAVTVVPGSSPAGPAKPGGGGSGGQPKSAQPVGDTNACPWH